MNSHKFSMIDALLLATCAAQLAGAAEVWMTDKDGSITTAANWETGVLPGADDSAYIRGGTTTLSAGETFGPVANFTVGRGYGKYTTNTISGGTLTVTNQSMIGWFSDGHGTVNMSGGTWNTGIGDMHIGEAGAGVLNLTGGNLNLEGNAFIGMGVSTEALLNLAGGTITLAAGKKLIISTDDNTAGIFRASSGTLDATATDTSIGIGVNNASIGNLEISGDALIKTSGMMVGGFWWWMSGGTGTVTQTGGQVILSGDGDFALANRNGTRGTYTISGGELITSNKTFFVGGQQGEHATLLSEGFLNVSGTGAVTVNYLNVGRRANATGTVTQNGGTVTVLSNLILGDNTETGDTVATGSYALNGGTLLTPDIYGGAGTSSFLFNGGTLQLAAAQSALLRNVGTVTIGAGGAVIDTVGHNDTITASLIGSASDGGVTKLGAGTLTLTGASNAWTGRTTVKAGTLNLNGMAVNGPIGLATDGELADATVTTDDITTYGDYALSLAVYGAGYANYSFGAVTADGGTLRLLNNVNGLIASALAWYDPSDASTITLADGTDVTGLANKGVGGSTLDLQTYSDTSRPFVSTDYTQNGHSVLVLTNTFGLVSKSTVAVTGDVDRTLFAVSKLDKGICDDDNNQMFSIELCNKDSWNEKGLTQIAQWPWYAHVGTYAITNDNQTGEFEMLENLPNLADNSLCAVWDLRTANKVVTGHCYKDSTLSTGSTNTVASFGTPAVGNLKLFVGMRNENPCGSKGTVGETLYFGRALSDDETAAVRGYLTTKWLGAGTAPTIGTTKLDTLVLTNNAVVDLDGATVEVGTLSGSGTISNGTLLVTGDIIPNGTLTLADDAELTGGTLVITLDATGAPTGTLAATAGLDLAVLSLRVVNGSAFTAKSPDTVIVKAAAGRLTHTFKATNRTDTDSWSVSVDTTAGKAYLTTLKGTSVLLI